MLTMVDGIVGAVVLFFVVLGFMRGLTRSLTGLLGWMAAALLTIFSVPTFYPSVTPYVGHSLWIFIGVACLMFFLCLLLFFVVGDWLVNLVRYSRLRFVDSVAGAFFGFFKTILLFCGTYWMLVNFAPSLKDHILFQGTYTVPWIQQGKEILAGNIERWMHVSDAAQFFQQKFGFLDSSLKDLEKTTLEFQSRRALEGPPRMLEEANALPLHRL